MYHTYILFSAAINKYYVGFTTDVLAERLRRHNSNNKGFTGTSNDWEIKYFEVLDSKKAAIEREKEIKSWKSRLRIEKLITSQII